VRNKIAILILFYILILYYELLQDIQQGLDLGVVSPEILQNFFDLEKYPVISELTHRFQVIYFSSLCLYKMI
jgi:hypothetical protein